MVAVMTIVLGLIPGFAWLFFYLQEDVHPEPKRLIARTFIFGAASALVALAAELALIKLGPVVRIDEYLKAHDYVVDWRILLSILIAAFIEEAVKFGGAYYSVHKERAFDEPIDAMIYMVVASLGFATLENVGSVAGMIPGNGQFFAQFGEIFRTASFRFVGATLLHTITSGIIGYYWARSIRAFGAKHYLWFGIGLATVLHALFNTIIMVYCCERDIQILYPVAFVVAIGFFALTKFEELKRESV